MKSCQGFRNYSWLKKNVGIDQLEALAIPTLIDRESKENKVDKGTSEVRWIVIIMKR